MPASTRAACWWSARNRPAPIPGPACYGLGNDRPTVTDANVVLGFINPDSLAGGRLAIDKALSETAIADHVATRSASIVADAAHGIRAVANATMARAVRAVTVERGRDPRDLTLMAFGGNGGVHAFDLARQLGIRRDRRAAALRRVLRGRHAG